MDRRSFMKMIAAVTGAQFIPKIDISEEPVALPPVEPKHHLGLKLDDDGSTRTVLLDSDDYIVFDASQLKMKWYAFNNRIAVYHDSPGAAALDSYGLNLYPVNIVIRDGGVQYMLHNCTLRKNSVEVHPSGYMPDGTKLGGRTVYQYFAEEEGELTWLS